jgi:hypothetical protein
MSLRIRIAALVTIVLTALGLGLTTPALATTAPSGARSGTITSAQNATLYLFKAHACSPWSSSWSQTSNKVSVHVNDATNTADSSGFGSIAASSDISGLSTGAYEYWIAQLTVSSSGKITGYSGFLQAFSANRGVTSTTGVVGTFYQGAAYYQVFVTHAGDDPTQAILSTRPFRASIYPSAPAA